MTTKQDPEAWRKRVDRNLRDLNTRMDKYEGTFKESNDLINRKLDHLNTQLDTVLSMAQKASALKRGTLWLLRGTHKALSLSSTVGFGLLGLLTVAWVLEHAHSLTEAWQMFINVFNGSTGK